jgi:signal recognition particle subunit SRP54
MDELQDVKKALQPDYSFLVADAMTGQDAVHSAGAFDTGVGIDGVCLTKLDGDARGGAALSIRAVTGKPIYFAGIGEKSEDLEPFHPDRLAQRILGMGDVLTLVEKAQTEFDADQAEAMQKKLRREQFTLQDFLDHMQKVKKMGSLKSLLGMIPGIGAAIKEIDIPDDAFKPYEAMIRSMTAAEREKPELIDGSRRRRIAAGAGCDPADINGMLKEFQSTRKMMSQMMQAMGGGGGMMRAMMGGKGGAGAPALPQRHGAINQKQANAGDPMAPKLKSKHRRKRKTKKKH